MFSPSVYRQASTGAGEGGGGGGAEGEDRAGLADPGGARPPPLVLQTSKGSCTLT